jgi:hypothetical protein
MGKLGKAKKAGNLLVKRLANALALNQQLFDERNQLVMFPDSELSEKIRENVRANWEAWQSKLKPQNKDEQQTEERPTD